MVFYCKVIVNAKVIIFLEGIDVMSHRLGVSQGYESLGWQINCNRICFDRQISNGFQVLSHLEDRLRILFLEFNCRNLKGFVMKAGNVKACINCKPTGINKGCPRNENQAKIC